MSLDPNQFFKACNPSKTLILSSETDRRLYIDFTTARTARATAPSLTHEIYRTITREDRSYHLFTGHIGCGKSTELRKLQYDLENHNPTGYHVVYIDSSEDLVMTDVDISDILLTIARQVNKSLITANIHLEPTGFRSILHNAWNILQSEVDLSVEPKIPGMGSVSAKTSGELSLDSSLGKFSAKLRSNPNARTRLRQHLEPQTDSLINLINQELLQPANEALQAQGKSGLVVIIDSLDRLENTQDRNQAEYIFLTRGEQLRQFACHIVYTLPLGLTFSNAIGPLRDRFGGEPKVLPMVRIQNRDGIPYPEGIALLRQLILARAFPALPSQAREAFVSEIFDHSTTCDRICTVSGGHIRNLLVLLYGCLQKQDPPLLRDTLEDVIALQRDSLIKAIQTEEWHLLRQVHSQKAVIGEESYKILLRSLFAFEYRDEKGAWFGINPILASAPQLNENH